MSGNKALWGLAGIVLASPASRFVAEQLAHQPTLCPLLRFTGIPCPSCGGTRASFLLLSGDPVAAFRMNAGLTVFVLGLGLLTCLGIVRPSELLGVANAPKAVAECSQ